MGPPLPLYHMDSRDQTQVIRFVDKDLVIYWRVFALWENWAMSNLDKITRTSQSLVPPKFTLGTVSLLGLLTEQWVRDSGQDK